MALASPGASADSSHRIRPGESLSTIARDHGISIASLIAHNRILREDHIQAGTKLSIPDGSQPLPRLPPQWVMAKPPLSAQTTKSSAERGGNPCRTKDPGFGSYGDWDSSPMLGKMLAPKSGGLDENGEFDVLFHFHGTEPVRKEWGRGMRRGVLVAVDLGIGSGPYSEAFGEHARFRNLVASVEAAMAKRHGVAAARVRHVGLSAWSAGYGAVGTILNQSYGRRRVDSVFLLDGLHAGYSGVSMNPRQLQPYADFARRAAAGDSLMFVSHSSILPNGYASTTETAQYLTWATGGQPVSATPRRSDPLGLELISKFSQNKFHVRGFSGSAKADHCAHVALLREVFRVHLMSHWAPPADRRTTSR